MKTTLIIPDPLFRALKRRAADEGKKLSTVVAEALRRGLAEDADPDPLPPLPTFHRGPPLVDVADRDALYRAMEEGS